MNATVVWILALLLPAAATADPAVYHSTTNGGRPAAYWPTTASPYPITAGNPRQLYLYIDNTPAVGASPSGGTMCVSKTGGETCAFDVRLEMTTDLATFVSFQPGAAGIVGVIDPNLHTLRVNGINVGGMAIPAPIGTLTVNAAGAHQLSIDVVGAHRVGAAGQLDAIQRKTIVPEPARGAMLGTGIAALIALHRLQRRLRPEPR
jgi:hypothetical protein